MPYMPSITSRIARATNAVQGADLGTTMFVSTNNFLPYRTMNFSSIQEVRDMDSISTDSSAYQAALMAFSAGAARFMLGKRIADKATYTLDTNRIGKVTTYEITVSTGENISSASYESLTEDDAETILGVISSSLSSGAAEITATVVGTTDAAVLEITDSGTVNHVVDSFTDMTVAFESTEPAATLLGEILEEAEQDFYFLTCEDHTEEFVLQMAPEIEATESSDYPKQYHFSVQESNVLTPVADPAIDTLGKVQELGYTRTAGRWHHNADTIFPEVWITGKMGQSIAGTKNWKFQIPNGIDTASDLVTGKSLSSGKQGYIKDRNASWFGTERGQTFNHGGKVASGEWADVIRSVDFLNDLIETRLLNLQLNASTNGKISFTSADKSLVANVVDSVLAYGVDLKILTGYKPCSVPDEVPFEDQANRILQGLNWTGYLAGAVNFIVVDGVLTYKDSSLS